MDKGQENFVALYEMHLTGIAEKDIPPNATAIFSEMPRFRPKNIEDIQLIKQQFTPIIVKFATEKDIPIVFGDAAPEELWINWFRDFATLMTPAVTMAILKKVEEREFLSGKKPSAETMSRREFLKISSIAVGGWFLAPKVATLPGMVSTLGKEQNAITKFSARLSGILSHFHPEDMYVLLRNLLMSHKLCMAEEQQRYMGIEKPIIPYRVGLAHGGMEDMLPLGKDRLRKLILLYPKPVLKQVIAYAGIDHLVEVDFAWLNYHNPQLLAMCDEKLLNELKKI